MRRNINEVRDIVILTKVSKVQKDVVSELREKKVHLIEEDTLLPGITFDRVRSILEKNKGDVSSAGWFLQGSSSKTPVAKPDGTKMFCSAFLNDARMCCFLPMQ